MRKNIFSNYLLINSIFLILCISSCSKTDKVEIVFLGKKNELLRLIIQDDSKFYQKDNRIKALDVGESQLELIKEIITEINFVSLQISGREVYRPKWYKFGTSNIMGVTRACVYQSIKNKDAIMIFYCDDVSIEFDNCSLNFSLNQYLLDYLEKKEQLHSIDLINLKDFARVSYGPSDRTGAPQ